MASCRFPVLNELQGTIALFALEEGVETHSGILAWRIPWTGEPGGLQFMGSQRVKHS